MTYRMLATGLALLAAVPVGAAHPHYEGLLREGTFALERGELQEAVHDLRLACFGLLEEPPTLALCLARLALAQAGIPDDEGFRETFGRVVDVEERFRAYSEGELPPELRAAFEREVAARVPTRILETTPSFAWLVEPIEEPAAVAAAEKTAADGESPPAVAEAPGELTPLAAEAAPEAAPAGEPGTALSVEDAARLTSARVLLAGAATRQELERPYLLARQVAEGNPASREAQHLTAIIAYRATRWQEAVRYFRRGGDPGEGDPELLFYLAVSLYEAGERSAAAEVLRRSLPRIEHTPFVRSYRSKILGTEAEPPAPGVRP